MVRSLPVLDRKLLREAWEMRGQMISIVALVAVGIMTVITMRGGYESLTSARDAYYREARFPDVWATLERAPESVQVDVAGIPGVAVVETRVTLFARLDLPGLEVPGMGRFVSLPERGRPAIGALVLAEGRLPASGARDEAVVNDNFAAARGLRPGDSVRAILNGRMRSLEVVGTAMSPEFSYAVPPGALYPDDDRYGIFWMRRDVLGPVDDMDGAFNELVLTLAPDAKADQVLADIDERLDRYGGRGAYLRADQFSHRILQSELDSNRVMSTAIPVVFLAVAAFLLNLVLNRLVGTQRTQIGVLKAFGRRPREVGWHFMKMALAAALVGTVIGVVGGVWLGGRYMTMYGAYFNIPQLVFRLRPTLLLGAAAVSLVAAVAGAWSAVRSVITLPPAEAMRPEAPARFEPGPIERSGLGRRLPSAARMILRNVERRPVRALFSSLGVAFSVAILVVGMFMFDGIDLLMDLQFGAIQREDLQVTFRDRVGTSMRHALAGLDGVEGVETVHVEPARIRFGHRSREVAVQGLDPTGRLRRIVAADGSVRPVPAQGVVVSAFLANLLGAHTGDTVQIEFLEGRRAEAWVPLAGVVDDFLGISATLAAPELDRLAGTPRVASSALLSVRDDARAEVLRRVEGMPEVAQVESPAHMLASFETQLADSLFIAVGFLLGFAGIISVAVIYNGARIALSERGRELASLRVMGFRRGEVGVLLLGEQALVTVVAIPVGWALGSLLASAVAHFMQNETYRIPLVVGTRTYVVSALVTLVAAAASGWIVRRRIRSLDLIAVLKTRE